MFDLSLEKLVVIGLLALFLVGPDQLPKYAAKLGAAVRVGRRMLDDAKGRLGDELGVEAAQIERLDPRRYHPRRLLQEAWESGGVAAPVAVVADRAEEPDPLDELDRRDEEERLRASAA